MRVAPLDIFKDQHHPAVSIVAGTLVVLTGGHEAPDRVRQEHIVKDFVRAMDTAGKIVAGLCHGPWIMISAGIMRDRRACAYPGLRDDMINAGANVIDNSVVIDDNIVTCSYYGDVGAFMKTVITLAQARAHADIAA